MLNYRSIRVHCFSLVNWLSILSLSIWRKHNGCTHSHRVLHHHRLAMRHHLLLHHRLLLHGHHLLLLHHNWLLHGNHLYFRLHHNWLLHGNHLYYSRHLSNRTVNMRNSIEFGCIHFLFGL